MDIEKEFFEAIADSNEDEQQSSKQLQKLKQVQKQIQGQGQQELKEQKQLQEKNLPQQQQQEQQQQQHQQQQQQQQNQQQFEEEDRHDQEEQKIKQQQIQQQQPAEQEQLDDQFKGNLKNQQIEDRLQILEIHSLENQESLNIIENKRLIQNPEVSQRLIVLEEQEFSKNNQQQQVIDTNVKVDNKQEHLKHEQQGSYGLQQAARQEQLRVEMQKKLNENSENITKNKWQPLIAQESQTKMLHFQGERNSYKFWSEYVSNEAKDYFFTLFDKQTLQRMLHQINAKMKEIFFEKSQQDLKKRLFRLEQVYEYFGVKILMGYNRMPDPEDYFNQDLPFRSKIGEYIKEGRFKYLEQNVILRDEVLAAVKYHNRPEEILRKFSIEGEVYSYITKKLNKLFRNANDISQCLILTKNNLFEAQDANGSNVECILLMDGFNQFIISVRFCYRENISHTIFNILDPFKYKNFKLYFYHELLTLEEVQILAQYFQIYPSGIVQYQLQQQTQLLDKIIFEKADIMTNNIVMLLRVQVEEGNQKKYFASTADGFHKTSSQDKRSYASVIYNEHKAKSELYPALSDQYRCLFSQATLNGAVFTELQEIVIWNSFVAYKQYQKQNSNIKFLDFRLLLASQLLKNKLKQDTNPIEKAQSVQISYPKFSTIGTSTDIVGRFSQEDVELLPKQNFHVPKKCVPPTKLKNKVVCLVCKKVPAEMVECKSCSELSGKLITLCATECFSMFHQEPKKYVQTAMDLPVLQQSAQYEQSNLGNSEAYKQSYHQRQQK